MKKYLLFLLLLFFTIHLPAQEIERQVLSSAGETMEAGDLSLVSTVGEVVIETETDNSLSLTQGFHQAALTIVNTIDFDFGFNFSVFPNPTTELVYISSDATENLSLTIVDLEGRKLSTQELTLPIDKEAIDVASLPAAQYFLQISNASGKLLYMFTLQKITK